MGMQHVQTSDCLVEPKAKGDVPAVNKQQSPPVAGVSEITIQRWRVRVLGSHRQGRMTEECNGARLEISAASKSLVGAIPTSSCVSQLESELKHHGK